MGQTCRTHGTRGQNGTQKISLALGIHCCPILIYLSCPTSFSVLWRTFEYIHMSDCVETVYELPLLPNNTASETSLHQSGAVRSVDWIFITGAPAWRWLGDNVTLDKTFYNIVLKQEVIAASVTATFSSLSHSSMRPLLEILYNNYTKH